MDNFFNIVQQSDDMIRRWGYISLFAASWIEGFNSLILGGFIASLGKLNLWLVLLAATAGHALSGYSWYAVGYFGGAKALERFGKYLHIDSGRLEQAKRYFEKYGGRAILVTKFTVGFTIAALILAGILKMQLRKFGIYNFSGSVVWAALTVFFGYTFGHSFKLLARYMESFTYTALLIIVLIGAVFALWYGLRAVFRISLVRATSSKIMSLAGLSAKDTLEPQAELEQES